MRFRSTAGMAGVRGHDTTNKPSFSENDKVLGCVPGASFMTRRYFPYLNSCTGYLTAAAALSDGSGDRRSPETMSWSPWRSMLRSSLCKPGTSRVADTRVDCGSSHNSILKAALVSRRLITYQIDIPRLPKLLSRVLIRNYSQSPLSLKSEVFLDISCCKCTI